VQEGAKFCPFCAARIDGDAPAGVTKGSTFKQARSPEPPAGNGTGEEEKAEAASSTFCHICHESTPAEQLLYDVDGNRVCRQCMLSGKKKKSARSRAIEAMKAEVEGKDVRTVTRLTHKGPTKTMQRSPEAEPKGGLRILPLAIVLLLLAGAGGGFAVWWFVVRPGGSSTAGGSGTASTPAAPKKPAGTPDDGGKPEGTGDDAGTKDPAPLERSFAPRWFEGTFRGVHPTNGILSGAMMFESPMHEVVYVIPPSPQLANTFEKGTVYRFKFKPDDLFYDSRRVTYPMLEEPPREKQ